MSYLSEIGNGRYNSLGLDVRENGEVIDLLYLVMFSIMFVSTKNKHIAVIDSIE